MPDNYGTSKTSQPARIESGGLEGKGGGVKSERGGDGGLEIQSRDPELRQNLEGQNNPNPAVAMVAVLSLPVSSDKQTRHNV